MDQTNFIEACLDYEEPVSHNTNMETIPNSIHELQSQTDIVIPNTSNGNSDRSSNPQSPLYTEIENVSLKGQIGLKSICRLMVFFIIGLLGLAGICLFILWVTGVNNTSSESQTKTAVNSSVYKDASDTNNKGCIKDSSLNCTDPNEDPINLNPSTISNMLSAKDCLNGGTFIVSQDECLCKNHYFGNRCEMTGPGGTDFIIILPEQYNNYQTELKLFVATNITLSASIFDFNTLQRRLFIVNKHFYVQNLSDEIIMKDGFDTKGSRLSLNTPKPVFAFIHNDWFDNSEGYLAFPIRFASTKYVIATYAVSRFRRSTFISKATVAISSIDSNTELAIHLKMRTGNILFHGVKYKNNDMLDVSLGNYQTFQLSHTSDLSGTLIIGTRPFLVVVGNVCNYIESFGGCNPFLEMNLPTTQLDDFYVIPIIETRSKSTLRILTLNKTSVRIDNGVHTIIKELNNRDFIDVEHYDMSCVQASDSVMVMIYPHEIRNYKGDAFMMTIHGVNQYLPEYSFVVPSKFESYISVTIVSEEADGFILDDKNVDKLRIYNISCNYNNFSTFSIRVANGFHYARHIHQVRFGLWVYGNARYNAYGYPGGIAFLTSPNITN